MRWTRASGALILLTACLLVSSLLLPQGDARRSLPFHRVDREGVPLPWMALARLGRKSRQIYQRTDQELLIDLNGEPHGEQPHLLIHWYTDPELPINSAYFTSDGRSLILETEDGALRIRDWATGYERRCWHSAGMGAFRSPLPISLSPDGRLLAQAIDNRTIRLRDVQTNKEVRTLHTAGDVWFLSFSPDGELLVSHAFERTQMWSLRTGEEVKIGEFPFHALDLLLFSPDGRWLVFQRGVVFAGQCPNPVYFWDRAAKRVQYVINSSCFWQSLHHFTRDGRMVAGVDWDRRSRKSDLVLWDTASGGERLRLPADSESIQAMAVSPSGGTLALGYGDGIIRLWDVATGKVRQSFRGDQRPIRSLAFSTDGGLLASVGENKTVLVWNIKRPSRRREDARSLSRQELETCWQALTDFDAARAFKAQQTLASAPRSALEFLRRHLRPVVLPEPERVQRLIADLDSESYQVRERAMRQLEQLGDGTEVHLRRALRQKPSLELRRRVERLLEMLAASSPRHLRDGRMLEVLEWLDTAESRRLLKELAGGAADVWLTREAKAARERRAAREESHSSR